MKTSSAIVLAAGVLLTGAASASAAPHGTGAYFLDVAERASREDCAAYLREEREARRRGDSWRADQLQDAYRSECSKRGE
jgi:hypothetical protein